MDRQETNKKHALNPEPGDYWHEMLFGVCVVLSVEADNVTICKHKKDVRAGYWTWDLEKTSTMSKYAFYEHLEYEYLKGKFWCSVIPKYMMWAVENYKSAIYASNSIIDDSNDRYFWEGCPI